MSKSTDQYFDACKEIDRLRFEACLADWRMQGYRDYARCFEAMVPKNADHANAYGHGWTTAAEDLADDASHKDL